jgi:hypothetical protein
MSDPVWLLGPLGNLRPLVCPEDDISITTERFGGIHQGLSGARVMDITGYRQSITFDFEFLTDTEMRWLRALHHRTLPGPYRLVSPVHTNRFTPESAMLKAAAGTRRGVTVVSGNTLRNPDYPALSTSLDMPGACLTWYNRTANAPLRWDESTKGSAVIPGESLTFSLYARSTTTFGFSMGIDWYDVNGTQLSGSANFSKTVLSTWARYSGTTTVPANAATGKAFIYTANTLNTLYLAASQLEASTTANTWRVGGGAPVVLVDQLTDVSPMFGYHNATLTLLEA